MAFTNACPFGVPTPVTLSQPTAVVTEESVPKLRTSHLVDGALEQRSVVHGGAGAAKKDQRPQSFQEAFCFLIVALDIHVHVRIRHAWVSAEVRPGSETLRVGIHRRASVVADE